MRIEKIESINFDKIYQVLYSSNITESEKTKFVQSHRSEIKKVLKTTINDAEFKQLMKNRVIQKFRPLKNSYTKSGDKIILAKALEISPLNVPKYIKDTTDAIKDIEKLKFLAPDKLEMIKTYVYRHGTKDELIAFLDYELTKEKDVEKCLYRTLEYYSGGVADYFIRPIHRMDNKTLVKLFNTINKHIKLAYKNGDISEVNRIKLAKWALVKIYYIQNNSKLTNAIKTYNILK